MPSWCAARNGAPGDQRCQSAAQWAWSVHGLWPQLGRGRDEGCPTTEILTPEAENIGTELLRNRDLVRHEWAKHGTCSGWPAVDYFRATGILAHSLRFPSTLLRPSADMVGTMDQFEGAWLTANPGLDGARLAVRCRNGELDELLFCFDGTGHTVRCPADVRDNCPREAIRVRGVGVGAP